MSADKTKTNKLETKQKPVTDQQKTETRPVIHLIDLYFSAGDWQVSREKLGAKNRLEVKFETEVTDQGPRHSYFIQKFNLTVKPDKSEEIVASFNCQIVVKCTSDSDVPTEFWKKYETEVLPVISVPYFREYVFSLSGKMGIPPIHVPHWVR